MLRNFEANYSWETNDFIYCILYMNNLLVAGVTFDIRTVLIAVQLRVV